MCQEGRLFCLSVLRRTDTACSEALSVRSDTLSRFIRPLQHTQEITIRISTLCIAQRVTCALMSRPCGFESLIVLPTASQTKSPHGWGLGLSGGGGGIRRVACGNARQLRALAHPPPGTCHRHVPPLRVRIPHRAPDGFSNKKAPMAGGLDYLAEEEGFEPS